MRLVVLAYQEIGYVCLEALLEAGADVAAVFTHDDDPDEEVWFRSVADLAVGHGIPVHKPRDPNGRDVVSLVRQYRPDLIFSFYYRHMLSDEFLASAKTGAYNMHGSLLPEYRGRAPINWVLVRGETRTGMTLHRMVTRPDAGPIVAQVEVPIHETDNVRSLYKKMADAAAGLMASVWPDMAAGKHRETPQDESRASYFGGRKPKDGQIDWQKPARSVYNLIRAVTHPYPGAFTFDGERKLMIWEAVYDGRSSGREPGEVLGYEENKGWGVACKDGVLYIRTANLEGEAELSGDDVLHLGLAPGRRLKSITEI